MKTKFAQIACPNCHSIYIPSANGNVVPTPLVCRTCRQAFSPRFYCPDANSPVRHPFQASKIYVDDTRKVYAFCPEHTFTTYTLAPEFKPRRRYSPIGVVTRFLDSLVFRAALTFEAWRWRLASRR